MVLRVGDRIRFTMIRISRVGAFEEGPTYGGTVRGFLTVRGRIVERPARDRRVVVETPSGHGAIFRPGYDRLDGVCDPEREGGR